MDPNCSLRLLHLLLHGILTKYLLAKKSGSATAVVFVPDRVRIRLLVGFRGNIAGPNPFDSLSSRLVRHVVDQLLCYNSLPSNVENSGIPRHIVVVLLYLCFGRNLYRNPGARNQRQESGEHSQVLPSEPESKQNGSRCCQLNLFSFNVTALLQKLLVISGFKEY